MKGIINCWEFKKCGLHPGGEMAEEFGVCPVTTATFADGLNRGINGGRICWVIKERLCRDDSRCVSCDFFNLLEQEEVASHIPLYHEICDTSGDIPVEEDHGAALPGGVKSAP